MATVPPIPWVVIAIKASGVPLPSPAAVSCSCPRRWGSVGGGREVEAEFGACGAAAGERGACVGVQCSTAERGEGACTGLWCNSREAGSMRAHGAMVRKEVCTDVQCRSKGRSSRGGGWQGHLNGPHCCSLCPLRNCTSLYYIIRLTKQQNIARNSWMICLHTKHPCPLPHILQKTLIQDTEPYNMSGATKINTEAHDTQAMATVILLYFTCICGRGKKKNQLKCPSQTATN